MKLRWKARQCSWTRGVIMTTNDGAEHTACGTYPFPFFRFGPSIAMIGLDFAMLAGQSDTQPERRGAPINRGRLGLST